MNKKTREIWQISLSENMMVISGAECFTKEEINIQHACNAVNASVLHAVIPEDLIGNMVYHKVENQIPPRMLESGIESFGDDRIGRIEGFF